jgi:nitroimidazol reductase NimA-like FMN-containing flavoprotein (pyridoxamine 5'-phosphate oxidase superfamily)
VSERLEPPSPATRVRRLPELARYDRAVIDAILDEALFCHVGIVDEGRPVVVPMLHARDGDRLLLHGSPASRLVRVASEIERVCVAVTLFDGLVLARSVYHHTANYRSVMLFGRAVVVEDPSEKSAALQAFTEKLTPGRWDEARRPSERESAATAVLAVAIDEASAKVRTGPPADDEEDLGGDVWAGVVPYRLVPGEPEPDPEWQAVPDLPPSVRRLLGA